MAGGKGAVADVRSMAVIEATLRDGKPFVLHFWAPWCDACKQMDQVFAHLATDYPHASFLRVEAEEQTEISEAYAVSAVPYFVFCKDGKTVDSLEGANPASLANKAAKLAGPVDPSGSHVPAILGMAPGPIVLETVKAQAQNNGFKSRENASANLSESLKKRLQELANSHPVFIFMKGSPEEPKCGFSEKIVDILKKEGIEFGSFDILTDNEVREGMKRYSNWPTFPPLFCKGELLGGCDIAIAVHESGELKETFRDHGILPLSSGSKGAGGVDSDAGKGGITESTGLSTALSSRLEELLNSSPVMLFMKGNPEEPRCGFSRKVVEILQLERVEFKSFDILTDDEVRQGLKVYSGQATRSCI